MSKLLYLIPIMGIYFVFPAPTYAQTDMDKTIFQAYHELAKAKTTVRQLEEALREAEDILRRAIQAQNPEAEQAARQAIAINSRTLQIAKVRVKKQDCVCRALERMKAARGIPAAGVSNIVGNVTVKRRDGREHVSSGTENLGPGDEVHTNQGFVEIVTRSGAILDFGPGSTFRAPLAPAPPPPGASPILAPVPVPAPVDSAKAGISDKGRASISLDELDMPDWAREIVNQVHQLPAKVGDAVITASRFGALGKIVKIQRHVAQEAMHQMKTGFDLALRGFPERPTNTFLSTQDARMHGIIIEDLTGFPARAWLGAATEGDERKSWLSW